MTVVKAMRIHAYGSIKELQLDEVPLPDPGEGEVRVQVHAVSVNPVDYKVRTGWVRAMFPEDPFPMILGADFSGVVDAIGPGSSRFSVGDAVIGMGGLTGAYTEALVIRHQLLAPKPRSLDFIQAAAVPLVGLTAWQALVDTAQVRKGHRLLIHAAAGGVGSIAVQLAHWMGAHVTGTASSSNGRYLQGLGADEVFDYASRSLTALAPDFDVVLDLIGGEAGSKSLDLVRPGGIVVVVAGRPAPREPDAEGRRLVGIVVKPDGERLSKLGEIIDSESLRIDVTRVFELRQAAEAHALIERGHTRGKIVLKVRE